MLQTEGVSLVSSPRTKGTYVGNDPHILTESWWKASSLIFRVGEVVEAT